ncbi:Fe(3+)-hydroxamate ABC transporter substrate-binding protein FhuD, partial [Erwinia amylovora]|nr:Fe(3+)-hydroxamate ABC transporter substrate-binding protein FhuD [Erwinia amylovora]
PRWVVVVGLSSEPNLELITQLQPSLILFSQGFGPDPARLQRIAPGLGFAFNDGSGKPLTCARHAQMALANSIERERQSQSHLEQMDALMQ